MPQSLAQVLVHLIFSTKNREPLLSDDIRPELHPYMATILKGMDSSAILINSVADALEWVVRSRRRPRPSAYATAVATAATLPMEGIFRGVSCVFETIPGAL